MSITSNLPDDSPYTFTIQGTGSPPAQNNHVYLPTILRNFVNAPGLAVEAVDASSSGAKLVSTNIGTALVASAFWAVEGAFDDLVARWRRQRTRWG